MMRALLICFMLILLQATSAMAGKVRLAVTSSFHNSGLSDSPGIVVQDNPVTNTYPMPIYAAGKNEVFVGRIRKDESQDKTINLWVVADNLRKGAATNAIQIAEYLLQENFI